MNYLMVFSLDVFFLNIEYLYLKDKIYIFFKVYNILLCIFDFW